MIIRILHYKLFLNMLQLPYPLHTLIKKFISETGRVGHFAPIGAYAVDTKRVLFMDPDRELFEHSWVPECRLVNSMKTVVLLS